MKTRDGPSESVGWVTLTIYPHFPNRGTMSGSTRLFLSYVSRPEPALSWPHLTHVEATNRHIAPNGLLSVFRPRRSVPGA